MTLRGATLNVTVTDILIFAKENATKIYLHMQFSTKINNRIISVRVVKICKNRFLAFTNEMRWKKAHGKFTTRSYLHPRAVAKRHDLGNRRYTKKQNIKLQLHIHIIYVCTWAHTHINSGRSHPERCRQVLSSRHKNYSFSWIWDKTAFWTRTNTTNNNNNNKHNSETTNNNNNVKKKRLLELCTRCWWPLASQLCLLCFLSLLSSLCGRSAEKRERMKTAENRMFFASNLFATSYYARKCVRACFNKVLPFVVSFSKYVSKYCEIHIA